MAATMKRPIERNIGRPYLSDGRSWLIGPRGELRVRRAENDRSAPRRLTTLLPDPVEVGGTGRNETGPRRQKPPKTLAARALNGTHRYALDRTLHPKGGRTRVACRNSSGGDRSALGHTSRTHLARRARFVPFRSTGRLVLPGWSIGPSHGPVRSSQKRLVVLLGSSTSRSRSSWRAARRSGNSGAVYAGASMNLETSRIAASHHF